MLLILHCLTQILIRCRILSWREGMMWTSPETPEGPITCSKWSNDSVQDKGIERGIECIDFECFNQVRIKRSIRVSRGDPSTCVWVAWPRDHKVRIIWYQSLAPLIRLYPSEIFISCWFRKNSLVSNFFFSLNLRHIKKYCYFILLLFKISVA